MKIKWSFPGGTSGKESACQCRRCQRYSLEPWAGKTKWSGMGQRGAIFFFFCNQGIHTTCTLTNRGKQIAFFCMRISVYSKIIRINILKRVEILHVLKKILKFCRISQLAEAMTSKVKTERKAFLAKRNCCSSQRSPFNMGLGRKGSLSFLSYREREPGLCLS